MEEREVLDLAARHGCSPESVTAHPSLGVDNLIWFLGDELVLRTPKDQNAVRYMKGELQIWPFIQGGGVCVPKAVEMGETESGLPFMLQRRVRGQLLGECEPDVDLAPFIEDLVEQMVILHGLPAAHRRDWRRPYDHFDPWPAFRKVAQEELLPPEHLREIEAWIEFLADHPGNFVGEVGEARHTERDVLTHNDLHPWNIMVIGEAPRLTGLLDWGDSCVSDRRTDLCTMPLALQIRIAEAYREAVGDVHEAFEARCMWAWLDMALWEIRDLRERGFRREWWRWPVGGWPEVKSILSQSPTAWKQTSMALS